MPLGDCLKALVILRAHVSGRSARGHSARGVGLMLEAGSRVTSTGRYLSSARVARYV